MAKTWTSSEPDFLIKAFDFKKYVHSENVRGLLIQVLSNSRKIIRVKYGTKEELMTMLTPEEKIEFEERYMMLKLEGKI